MIDRTRCEEAAQAIEQDILAKELPMVPREYGIDALYDDTRGVFCTRFNRFTGVCAIGCYLVGREATDGDEVEAASFHLRVPRQWVEGLVHGFDGYAANLGCGAYEEAILFRYGYQVGQHLREKYLTLDQQYLVPPGGLKGP